MGAGQAAGAASQPIVYQTPQGLVYATPHMGVGGIPESYIINLPQGPAIAVSPEQQAAAVGEIPALILSTAKMEL